MKLMKRALAYTRQKRAIPTVKKIGGRGDDNRRVIRVIVKDGLEKSYHATKGWRTRRA